MKFNFEPAYRGWYPAQIEPTAWNIQMCATNHPALIFHDFVDHGPDADFSLLNEVRAIGSAKWTRSGAAFLDDTLNTPEHQEVFEEGYRWSQKRWPRGVRLHHSFQGNLSELLKYFDEARLEYFRRSITLPIKSFDITLYVNEDDEVFYRSGVGADGTSC